MAAIFRAILYRPLYNLFIWTIALIPGHNVAVAIIILTVLVRLILTPIKLKMLESQAKQRHLQPELKALQEKYKDDKQGYNMAMMQMYKDKGINPASGCLPTVIQFVVLIVLYYVFRRGFTADAYSLLYSFVHAPQHISLTFFWIKDLTLPDKTFILPVIAGVAQFFYSRALMQIMPMPSNDPNDMASMMNKQMMYMTPIITVVAATRFASALSVYWAVAALVDWGQQTWLMKRFQQDMAASAPKVTVRKKKEAS